MVDFGISDFWESAMPRARQSRCQEVSAIFRYNIPGFRISVIFLRG